ncbi:MAG: N-acetylmuramic acid 6-phosphate etherase, partial [Alkalibacterium sp.]|nr:N-acetylmuramic acid 6-phosphate etherase [Alkalibacterium sp.]
AMVGIGKVYKNLMVDVQPTNEKLVTRAENIVMKATDVEREEAKKALADSNGKVKVAIIMILLNINEEEAVKKLEESEGHVRRAL